MQDLWSRFRIFGVLVMCLSSLQAERLYFNKMKVPESREDLEAIQSALQNFLVKSRAATVCVQVGQGSGTGVIVSEEGLVLTAAHVVTGVKKDLVVVMEDGAKYEAQSLGLNANNDAAMLQIKTQDGEKFPFVEIEEKAVSGRSKSQLGDWVYTLGHSDGFDKARGLVLRLGRLVRIADSTVQSDCSLIGGDSGGPLFDMDGKLIAIHSRVGHLIPENLHVPIQAFHKDWDRLLNLDFIGDGPFAKKPQLGLGFIGVAVEKVERGMKITQVAEEYPAALAGLNVGDVIVMLRGEKLSSREKMEEILKKCAAGDKLEIQYLREEKLETVEVTLVKK